MLHTHQTPVQPFRERRAYLVKGQHLPSHLSSVVQGDSHTVIDLAHYQPLYCLGGDRSRCSIEACRKAFLPGFAAMKSVTMAIET